MSCHVVHEFKRRASAAGEPHCALALENALDSADCSRVPVQRHCKAVLLVRHSTYCESQSRPNSSGPWTPARIAQVRSNRHGRLADPRPEEAAATVGHGAARFAGPALHQLQAQGHDGREAGPNPATYTILTLLEAGRSVFLILLLTNTVFFVHLEEHNHFFIHFLASKHCLGHFCAPPLLKPG